MENEKLEKIRESALSVVRGSRLSDDDIEEISDEIIKANSIDDIYNIIDREADNAAVMWDDILQNVRK